MLQFEKILHYKPSVAIVHCDIIGPQQGEIQELETDSGYQGSAQLLLQQC